MKTCAEVAKEFVNDDGTMWKKAPAEYQLEFLSCSDFPKDPEPLVVWAVVDDNSTAVFRNEFMAKTYREGMVQSGTARIAKLREIME